MPRTSDTNIERSYVIDRLKLGQTIGDVTSHSTGDRLTSGRVNHYTTDGEIAFARLLPLGTAVAS